MHISNNAGTFLTFNPALLPEKTLVFVVREMIFVVTSSVSWEFCFLGCRNVRCSVSVSVTVDKVSTEMSNGSSSRCGRFVKSIGVSSMGDRMPIFVCLLDVEAIEDDEDSSLDSLFTLDVESTSNIPSASAKLVPIVQSISMRSDSRLRFLSFAFPQSSRFEFFVLFR